MSAATFPSSFTNIIMLWFSIVPLLSSRPPSPLIVVLLFIVLISYLFIFLFFFLKSSLHNFCTLISVCGALFLQSARHLWVIKSIAFILFPHIFHALWMHFVVFISVFFMLPHTFGSPKTCFGAILMSIIHKCAQASIFFIDLSTNSIQIQGASLSIYNLEKRMISKISLLSYFPTTFKAYNN